MATSRNLGACMLLAAGLHAVAWLSVGGQMAEVGVPPTRDLELALELAPPAPDTAVPNAPDTAAPQAAAQLEEKALVAERPTAPRAGSFERVSLGTRQTDVRAGELHSKDIVPAEPPSANAIPSLAGSASASTGEGASATGSPGETTRGAILPSAHAKVGAVDGTPRLTRGAHCEDLFSPRTAEQTVTFLVRVAPNGTSSLERALGPIDPVVLGGADRCIHRLHFENPRTAAGARREDALVKIRLKIRGSRA